MIRAARWMKSHRREIRDKSLCGEKKENPRENFPTFFKYFQHFSHISHILSIHPKDFLTQMDLCSDALFRYSFKSWLSSISLYKFQNFLRKSVWSTKNTCLPQKAWMGYFRKREFLWGGILKWVKKHNMTQLNCGCYRSLLTLYGLDRLASTNW